MGWHGFLAVGLGAATGAWMRWGLGALMNAVIPNLPIGTLVANLSGGYMIGLAMGLISLDMMSVEMRLLIVTGFLGGLTTFSTFSAESVSLIAKGEYWWMSAHLFAHVAGSLLMTGLGLMTIQLFKH